MNLKKSILSIILLLVTTICVANDSTYVFPLNPDMPEWTTLPVEVKYQMFQIPEAELSVISTEKLVSAYLNYPVIGVILAYNNLNDGFKRVYNDFNGLRELVKRADGPQNVNKGHHTLSPNSSPATSRHK